MSVIAIGGCKAHKISCASKLPQLAACIKSSNCFLRPKIPYQYITERHLCYDLIYNPIKTKFLILSEKEGASIINGNEMLENQAIESWKIWNS